MKIRNSFFRENIWWTTQLFLLHSGLSCLDWKIPIWRWYMYLRIRESLKFLFSWKHVVISSIIFITGLSGQDWKIPIWRWSTSYWRKIVQFFKFCWSSQQLVWKFVKRGAGIDEPSGLTILWQPSRLFLQAFAFWIAVKTEEKPWARLDFFSFRHPWRHVVWYTCFDFLPAFTKSSWIFSNLMQE